MNKEKNFDTHITFFVQFLFVCLLFFRRISKTYQAIFNRGTSKRRTCQDLPGGTQTHNPGQVQRYNHFCASVNFVFFLTNVEHFPVLTHPMLTSPCTFYISMLTTWFKHICYFISHEKRLGRAKMRCHSPLLHNSYTCILR